MVSYESMEKRITEQTDSYLSQVGPDINTTKPVLEIKGKEQIISFSMIDFSDSHVTGGMNLIRNYYRSVTFDSYPGMKNFCFDCFIDDPKKETKLRVDIRNPFDFFSEFKGEVKISKQGEWNESDVEFAIELWKKYAGNQKDSRSLGEMINEAGAVFYEKNDSWTWSSIIGYELLKEQVRNTVILPFTNPDVYLKVGEMTRSNGKANLPRAVLFEGPPGTGKTTMARVIANETGASMIYIPIESIMSKWYGESENRLGNIFDLGSKLERSIIFIDEIDSLAGSRDSDMNEASRRILSVLLRKMQGFIDTPGMLTIGATNRPQDLDRALLSRFNRRLFFGLPDAQERAKIFSFYAKHLNEEETEILASKSGDIAGRDIEDICSDAERNWCGKLIQSSSEVSVPPIEEYLASIKTKEQKEEQRKTLGF